jgi:hypothetical protein
MEIKENWTDTIEHSPSGHLQWRKLPTQDIKKSLVIKQ